MKRLIGFLTLLILLPLSVFSNEKKEEIKKKIIRLTITVDSKDLDQYDLEQLMEDVKRYDNINEIKVETVNRTGPVTICIVK